MAERTKFACYMAYSIIISTLIYPVLGHWIWGLGWLADRGFWDFAGSTVAAAAGGIAAIFGARSMFGKREATMVPRGVLAGLVAITAPCLWVSVPGAVIIGAVGGGLVVPSVVFIDHALKIDDPVGAISVHGVCGAWGTLAVGLFAMTDGDAATAARIVHWRRGPRRGRDWRRRFRRTPLAPL